jgi:DNA-binding MarR family transcriptional regulator
MPPKPCAPNPIHDAPAPEAAAQVLRRFRSVFNAVKTHFQQVQRSAGIGGAQLWALSVISNQPGIGVGGLAAAMDIHQSTASNLLKALLKAELVLAHRDGVDRRALRLRVTAAGNRVLRRAPGPFAGVLPEALSQLDAETLSRLDHDLGVLMEKLKADERAAGIPLAQL